MESEQNTDNQSYKLTSFSPGAGCGCKISPKDLREILKTDHQTPQFPNLLVGYDSSDDAAVYDIGNGQAVISTTDFFTPIVDDPFDFGRIAATNALSDIYAMGGKPLMAISVLGWPLQKLPAAIAARVIDGARVVCKNAGIPLAGGHSIDIADPVFGLAVTGIVETKYLKRNNTAISGDVLFLTKPLGIGIVSTAIKKGIASGEHIHEITRLMTTLNASGEIFGKLPYISAMTDVTGFALAGHLIEMCDGNRLSAHVEFNNLPVIQGIQPYIEAKAIPGGTYRNWKSYAHQIQLTSEDQRIILCDPQTSGGLLVAVNPEFIIEFLDFCRIHQIPVTEIGSLKDQHSGLPTIMVI